MQIRKTYIEVSPELLYAEIRDFTMKQGMNMGENKLETFTLPDESASFITRGTLTFNDKAGKEALRAHIVGMSRGETKLMLDVDEKLFPPEKMTSLQSDLDFIFGSYEVKDRGKVLPEKLLLNIKDDIRYQVRGLSQIDPRAFNTQRRTKQPLLLLFRQL